MALTKSSKKILNKKEPEKKLLIFLKRRAGRARTGKITLRRRGGGAKRLYRIVEFGQEKLDVSAKVIALEYDPYRTAFLALIEYSDGIKKYILACSQLRVGDEIIFSEKTKILPGNRMRLKNIPIGTIVYNIEINPGQGGKLVRGAGTGANLLTQEGKYVHLKMPSGEIRKILNICFASIGQVSHPDHRFEKIRKAGSLRLKGRRPKVRGSAMVPQAHPHGGGEGRAGIGLKHPKTPWGKPFLGVKTRRRKYTDKYIVQTRQKKK